MQLPPPVHGASVMNRIASRTLKDKLGGSLDIVDLNFSDDLSELRKVGIKKFLRLFLVLLNILKILMISKPKLVYFTLTPTGNGFYRDILIVCLIKLFRVEVVYHLHGKGISDRKLSIDKVLYRFVFRNSKVILLAECLYRDIASYIERDDVFILPNALDVKSIQPTTLEYDFGYLSNLVRGKGIIDFIASLYDLYKKGESTKSIVVGGYRGDGTEEAVECFLSKCPKEFVDSIEFTGALYGEEKSNTINTCKVFVFPTYIDTFPLVLIEALGLSKPCIVYDEGATSDIVDNNINGAVVEKGDKNALSQAMLQYVSDNKLIEEHAKNARSKYVNNYSIDKFEVKLINIIETILNGNS